MSSPFTKDLPKKENHISLKNAICKVIDEIPTNQEFTLIEFQKMVIRQFPQFKKAYLSTIQRYAIGYRRKNFLCINRAKSLYRKIEEK